MPISPVNLRWLIAPHDLHGMLTPNWVRRPRYWDVFPLQNGTTLED